MHWTKETLAKTLNTIKETQGLKAVDFLEYYNTGLEHPALQAPASRTQRIKHFFKNKLTSQEVKDEIKKFIVENYPLSDLLVIEPERIHNFSRSITMNNLDEWQRAYHLHTKNTNHENDKLRTLHQACFLGGLTEVNRLLLDPSLDVNQLDGEMNALHIACKFNHVALVKSLLSRHDIIPDKRSGSGSSTLRFAVQTRNPELIKILEDATHKYNILTTNKVPQNQTWLLDRMTAMGYKINPNGVCCGIGIMAKKAFLAGDYQTFFVSG